MIRHNLSIPAHLLDRVKALAAVDEMTTNRQIIELVKLGLWIAEAPGRGERILIEKDEEIKEVIVL